MTHSSLVYYTYAKVSDNASVLEGNGDHDNSIRKTF